MIPCPKPRSRRLEGEFWIGLNDPTTFRIAGSASKPKRRSGPANSKKCMEWDWIIWPICINSRRRRAGRGVSLRSPRHRPSQHEMVTHWTDPQIRGVSESFQRTVGLRKISQTLATHSHEDRPDPPSLAVQMNGYFGMTFDSCHGLDRNLLHDAILLCDPVDLRFFSFLSVVLQIVSG